jgi:hypothetical protein
MPERQEDRAAHRQAFSGGCGVRWLLIFLLVAAPRAQAELRSAEACGEQVAADPAKAREEAAVWSRTGGGVPARLCEAEALVAMGAHASAAQLLTALATNPNRAIPADARAVILADGARQWLAAGRPDLARAALGEAAGLTPPDHDRRILLARAAAAEGDWPAARTALEAEIATRPDAALPHALLAATLRHLDEPGAALAQAQRALALDPALPEAMFETGAALAETGDARGASAIWLKLIGAAPDSELAALARANLQRLN